MATEQFEALGFDPAPGIPESVQQLASKLNRAGQQLGETHSALSRLGKSGGVWEGEAATQFAGTVGKLPSQLGTARDSLLQAAGVIQRWETRLGEYRSLARSLETQAEAAQQNLKSAQSHPDLKLAGQTFDTEESLASAQQRLNSAQNRVNNAQEELNGLRRRAQELLGNHNDTAIATAQALNTAAESAPDKPGRFEMLLKGIKELGSKLGELANDVWEWIKEHADVIYDIGTMMGYASAACDLLAVVFSETVVGAAIFEAGARAFGIGALGFHALGGLAGSKNFAWSDLALDGFALVPFGGLAKGGVGIAEGGADLVRAVDGAGRLGQIANNIYGLGNATKEKIIDVVSDLWTVDEDKKQTVAPGAPEPVQPMSLASASGMDTPGSERLLPRTESVPVKELSGQDNTVISRTTWDVREPSQRPARPAAVVPPPDSPAVAPAFG
ncbi:putative T7SS-secreted protein [Streptomyces sp. NPDC048644]|uniref:putative T7SS-secreted protein n=1 Tax=Streptomyces sp. NPDC048644 TaxID=3365582 RepID=UPI00371D8153